MKPIYVKFVLSDNLENENEASDVMIQAYEACKQNKLKTCWIREKDICIAQLDRKNVLVFDSFDGKDFESFENTESAILGPWCLLICLMEGKKIPNFEWPIFNVAMFDCVVASSHLPKTAKLEICERVRQMGGYYTDTLNSDTTHLITDSVKTTKYVDAARMNIKIVTPPWVDAVWEASKNSNIHCNDGKFDKFKCLPFHKLNICSTGSKNLESRNKLEKLICENGGHFTPRLKLNVTDFLVCDGTRSTMSEKYKEARKTGRIQCVTPQWLYDSIEKGYCLPHEHYPVEKGTSTPEKNNHVNPNFSMISVINHSTSNRTTVNETALQNLSSWSNDTLTNKGNKRKVFAESDLVDKLDLKKAKKSGQFLDGCSVYLVGFKVEHREKLCKIINASGATRCDDMSDRVSHVLVGDSECHEFKLIQSKNYSCSFVTLQWLLDSIENKRPCIEEPYLINAEVKDSNFKSPLGRKGLSLLRSNKTITELDVNLSQKEQMNREQSIANEAEEDIMQQYLNSEATDDDTLANYLKNADYDSKQLEKPEVKTVDPVTVHHSNGRPSRNADIDPSSSSSVNGLTQSTFTESQSLDIFKELDFAIIGFDEEIQNELQEHILSGLGKMTFKISQANIIVAPSFVTEPLECDEEKLVSDVWIYESLKENELIPIKYYHRPLLIPEADILEDCVIAISGYTGYERTFLASLIDQLGGKSQEQFCRVTSVQKNLLRSTHLITAEASGRKYTAAKKWQLPAVGKDWLIECAKQKRRLDEDDFIVSEEHKTITTNDSSKNDSNKDSRTTEKTVDNTKNSAQSISLKTLQSPCAQNLSQKPETLTPNRPGPSSVNMAHNVDEGLTNHAVAEFGASQNDSDKEDSFTIPAPKNMAAYMKSRALDAVQKLDDPCSQVTPIKEIMRDIRMTNLLGTPVTPPLPKAPWDVDTPETPYGRFIESNPSKSLRKQMVRYLNQFPDKFSPPPRRKSTPLSELKRRLWEKIGSRCEDESEGPDEVFENKNDCADEMQSTQCTLVNTRLEELKEVATTYSASKSRRGSNVVTSSLTPENTSIVNLRETQPSTVQWDFGVQTQETSFTRRVFMISGVNDVDKREQMVSQLEQLGAQVSTTSSYDPECSHLLCPKPPRNEKTLSCMAAGKWILHTNYLNACLKERKFLDEEDYEFGNPNSFGKIPVDLDRDMEIRMQAIHFWRKEIARTGRQPFHDMKAILVAERKQALISVIEAGGGTVIDIKPPYKGIVHATHCLLEPKSVSNFSVYEPLAKQGIYCVNTLYLSEFLHRSNKDIKESILPFFQKYFK